MLIVTNPEIPSVTDALKTVMLARKNGKTVIGAIINKKLGKDYEMSDANVSEFLGIPILSAVPDDEKVRESISTKKAVVDLYPNNKASIGFKKAAARIVGQEYTDLEKTGLIGRLFSFLRK